MTILPDKARATTFYLFSTIILITITAFIFPAATQGQIQIRVPEGGTSRSAIQLRNQCAEPHTLRGSIKGDNSYVRFAMPADAVVLPGASTKNVDLIFSAGNLKQKMYKGSISWECTDCIGKCDIKIEDVTYEMTVIERPEITLLAQEFRKMLYDEIDKSGAIVEEDAREKLNEILMEGAKRFINSKEPKRREEANKNLKILAAALVANAERKKKPGNEFIFFLMVDDQMVITARIINRTLRGLCPLFPFC